MEIATNLDESVSIWILADRWSIRWLHVSIRISIRTIHIWRRHHRSRLSNAIKLNDKLLIETTIPWEDNLCHLSKRRQRLLSDEEVVCQVNFRISARLIHNKRAIASPDVHISETESKDETTDVLWQTNDILFNLLLPAMHDIKLELRQLWQGDLLTHNLRAFVSIETVSLSAFSLKLQLLADLDKLAFKMLKLAGH